MQKNTTFPGKRHKLLQKYLGMPVNHCLEFRLKSFTSTEFRAGFNQNFPEYIV